MKRKLITALDIFIIAALLAVCVFSFFAFNGSDLGTTAVITLENNEVYRLSLTQNTEKLIKTDYGYNKVVVENGITHEVVHRPPSYMEIPEFVKELCKFFRRHFS